MELARRMVSGHPLNPAIFSPGSAAGKAARNAKAVGDFVYEGLMTNAVFPNIVEAGAGIHMDVGFRDAARALISTLTPKGLRSVLRSVHERGYSLPDRLTMNMDPNRPFVSIAVAAKQFIGTFRRFVEGWGGEVAARAWTYKVKRWMERGPRDVEQFDTRDFEDVQALRKNGVPKREAEMIVGQKHRGSKEGKAPEDIALELLQQTEARGRGAVPRMTGENAQAGHLSPIEHNRVIQNLAKFTRYFAMKMRRVGPDIDAVAKAVRDMRDSRLSPQQKLRASAAAGKHLLRSVGLNVARPMAGDLLINLVMYGPDGAENRARYGWDHPVEYLLGGALFGIIGGPVGVGVRAVTGEGGIHRVITPVALAEEVVQAFNGSGTYRNMTTLQTAQKLLGRFVPAVKTVKSLGAYTGLMNNAEYQHVLLPAHNHYWRVLSKHKIVEFDEYREPATEFRKDLAFLSKQFSIALMDGIGGEETPPRALEIYQQMRDLAMGEKDREGAEADVERAIRNRQYMGRLEPNEDSKNQDLERRKALARADLERQWTDDQKAAIQIHDGWIRGLLGPKSDGASRGRRESRGRGRGGR